MDSQQARGATGDDRVDETVSSIYMWMDDGAGESPRQR